jgi:protein gp37/uncharacterized protein YbaR (Trm112 family)
MRNSGIGWTHDTMNFHVGCDHVSEECLNCYIAILIRKQIDWQTHERRIPFGRVYRTSPTLWQEPDRCQRELSGSDKARRIFTCSLSDFFHAKADEWRPEAWEIMKRCQNLVWLVLTKRPELVAARLPKDWGDGWPNVWLGVSVGCNRTLHRMDSLRRIPVHPQAVKFLSAEPLLEDISPNVNFDGFGWVIAGGESGPNPEHYFNSNEDWRKAQPGRRIMDLEWARNFQVLCSQRRIPFYFKQITAPVAGVGADALGSAYHQFPPPPAGLVWDEKDDGSEQKPTINLLDRLVCPACKKPLAWNDDFEWMTCMECRLRYPIRNGIPVLLLEEAIRESA